jgi:cytochrome c oxidase assembly protein subunit 15
LAVLTVCAAVPLLLLGAEVTTKKVGMVDPVGFREPWHLLRDWERASRELGYLIEHSHRLFGYLTGFCIIGLAVGLWLVEPRRWLRWLGLAALVGVSVQGVLGILRVNENAVLGTPMKIIHGCFAPIVFALLCSLAVLTSQSWTTPASRERQRPENPRLRRWSLLTAGLIYFQLVLGGFVRHTSSSLGQRGHLLMAFTVVVAVVWLVKLALENTTDRRLRLSVRHLAGLVVLQILLGVEAWMLKFPPGILPDSQPISTGQGMVRTLHYLVGASIFASAVIVSWRAHRQTAPPLQLAAAPVPPMEGAA